MMAQRNSRMDGISDPSIIAKITEISGYRAYRSYPVVSSEYNESRLPSRVTAAAAQAVRPAAASRRGEKARSAHDRLLDRCAGESGRGSRLSQLVVRDAAFRMGDQRAISAFTSRAKLA